MTLAAQRLASGDFGARVFLKGNDEFRDLAIPSTRRAASWSRFVELGHQKAELKSTIDSLREGHFVIDKRGEVVYCNESLKGDPEGRDASWRGRYTGRSSGSRSFIELMEKARSGGSARSKEWR